MADDPDTKPAWRIFASWHRDAEFWRSVWSQAVGALTAVLVVYLIGTAAGVFSRDPLLVLIPLFLAASVAFLVLWALYKLTSDDGYSPLAAGVLALAGAALLYVLIRRVLTSLEQLGF